MLMEIALAAVVAPAPVLASTAKTNLPISKAEAYNPISFLENRVKEITKLSLNRKDTHFTEVKNIEVRATRNEFLDALYSNGLLEASDLTLDLSDKLIVYRVLENLMGEEKAYHYHPKTMGLKYFLLKNHLVNSKTGELTANSEQIHKALEKEFPHGVIAKAAAGMNSAGKKNFYFKMDKFVADLLAPGTDLYSPEQFKTPFSSEMLGRVVSGEFMILQENIITAAGIKKPLETKEFMEVRLHTYEGHVLPGATFNRWKEADGVDHAAVRADAEKFLQEFLDQLPKEFLAQQAWSVDIAVLDNGVKRIIEFNTNRGLEGHWSGFMSRPDVLGAYTRYLEEHENVHFVGLAGFLLRNNKANYFKFLRKKYIEDTL